MFHNGLVHPVLALWPRLGNWLHDRTLDPSGEALIAAERRRQVEREGYSADHDDHTAGSLAAAARAYAILAYDPLPDDVRHGLGWPWRREELKKSPDPIRYLVKAGALYLAESERLARLDAATIPPGLLYRRAMLDARRMADGIAVEIDRLAAR